jgi:hypothetical protein
VLAASRITLPVFGGISGATRTMLNTAASLGVARARRPREHPDLDRRRARLLDDAGDLGGGAAVVMTSSTMATWRPRSSARRRGSTANAPRTLPARSASGSASWCAVSRTRSRSSGSAARSRRRATRRASSQAWL